MKCETASDRGRDEYKINFNEIHEEKGFNLVTSFLSVE